MAIDTQIFTNIDYHKQGKQSGYLEVPQSTNTSAWATQYIPITVVQNGNGPTALLFGGNHGDEYEGPVTLIKLAHALQPEQIQGRVIMLPMLNRPAVEAGTRLSPIDGQNMNRAFPGQRDGTLTSMIAHYVTNALLPLADLVIDIHSGGRSLHFLPSVNMHHVPDGGQMREMVRAGMAWGTPYVFIYRDVGGQGLLPSEAERMGKITLGTELGSAGQFGPDILNLTDHGVRNVLRCYDILTDEPFTPPAQPAQVVAAAERDDYIMAPASGIFEPFFEMGQMIENGQPIGQIHSIEQPHQEAHLVHARTSGMAISRRAFPLTRQGDCLFVLVRPFELA